MKKLSFINTNNYALITGGSEGIGFAFAERLASMGKPLLIVALPNDKLDKAKENLINEYKIECHSLGIDLTDNNSATQVLQWCQTNSYTVDFLINNAGLGSTDKFSEIDENILNTILMLNVYNTANMCRLFVNEMKDLSKSHILNVSSLAAFFPIPYKSLYAGSKIFINTFTKALAEEYKTSPINFHIVCPNGVSTNEAVKARMQKHGKIGKFVELKPEYLVDYSLKCIEKKKFMIIPKTVNKLLYFVSKNIPLSIQMKVLNNQFRKEIK